MSDSEQETDPVLGTETQVERDTGEPEAEAYDDSHDSDDAPEAGTRAEQPGADPEDEEKIEEERQERLDPDHRPDGAEVDNTDRDFDAGKGMFTDSEGYEEAEERFPAPGDQGA